MVEFESVDPEICPRRAWGISDEAMMSVERTDMPNVVNGPAELSAEKLPTAK